jgi:hypothetical protein
MNLVIGVVFGATLMGLFVPRWQLKHWILLGAWVMLVVAFFYLKNR